MTRRHKLTRNQDLVIRALLDAEGPLSAYTILDLLRGSGIRAPLQVYRALDKLRELGLVHRLECLNAFVACARPDCDRHELVAFAICGKCSQVSEFSDRQVETRLSKWAGDREFRSDHTLIEMRGTCGSCANQD